MSLHGISTLTLRLSALLEEAGHTHPGDNPLSGGPAEQWPASDVQDPAQGPASPPPTSATPPASPPCLISSTITLAELVGASGPAAKPACLDTVCLLGRDTSSAHSSSNSQQPGSPASPSHASPGHGPKPDLRVFSLFHANDVTLGSPTQSAVLGANSPSLPGYMPTRHPVASHPRSRHYSPSTSSLSDCSLPLPDSSPPAAAGGGRGPLEHHPGTVQPPAPNTQQAKEVGSVAALGSASGAELRSCPAHDSPGAAQHDLGPFARATHWALHPTLGCHDEPAAAPPPGALPGNHGQATDPAVALTQPAATFPSPASTTRPGSFLPDPHDGFPRRTSSPGPSTIHPGTRPRSSAPTTPRGMVAIVLSSQPSLAEGTLTGAAGQPGRGPASQALQASQAARPPGLGYLARRILHSLHTRGSSCSSTPARVSGVLLDSDPAGPAAAAAPSHRVRPDPEWVRPGQGPEVAPSGLQGMLAGSGTHFESPLSTLSALEHLPDQAGFVCTEEQPLLGAGENASHRAAAETAPATPSWLLGMSPVTTNLTLSVPHQASHFSSHPSPTQAYMDRSSKSVTHSKATPAEASPTASYHQPKVFAGPNVFEAHGPAAAAWGPGPSPAGDPSLLALEAAADVAAAAAATASPLREPHLSGIAMASASNSAGLSSWARWPPSSSCPGSPLGSSCTPHVLTVAGATEGGQAVEGEQSPRGRQAGRAGLVWVGDQEVVAGRIRGRGVGPSRTQPSSPLPHMQGRPAPFSHLRGSVTPTAGMGWSMQVASHQLRAALDPLAAGAPADWSAASLSQYADTLDAVQQLLQRKERASPKQASCTPGSSEGEEAPAVV
ncbi:hypothetical protein V8C86DRAFT_2613736 [Haematococcus lacustris]